MTVTFRFTNSHSRFVIPVVSHDAENSAANILGNTLGIVKQNSLVAIFIANENGIVNDKLVAIKLDDKS